MSVNRQQYNPAYKAKVALEALKEQKTIGQLSSEFSLHSTQITRWKKQLGEGASLVFAETGGKAASGSGVKVAELYQQIGELQVELNWLKKKLLA
jgi:transposase